MDSKPVIKDITFKVLDTIPENFEFYSTDITKAVRKRLFWDKRRPMDGTVTRYMRHYSEKRRRIYRVGPKENSYYRMGMENGDIAISLAENEAYTRMIEHENNRAPGMGKSGSAHEGTQPVSRQPLKKRAVCQTDGYGLGNGSQARGKKGVEL